MIDPMLDTLLNVWVFLFIGLLLYLYFKPDPKKTEQTHDPEDTE